MSIMVGNRKGPQNGILIREMPLSAGRRWRKWTLFVVEQDGGTLTEASETGHCGARRGLGTKPGGPPCLLTACRRPRRSGERAHRWQPPIVSGRGSAAASRRAFAQGPLWNLSRAKAAQGARVERQSRLPSAMPKMMRLGGPAALMTHGARPLQSTGKDGPDVMVACGQWPGGGPESRRRPDQGDHERSDWRACNRAGPEKVVMLTGDKRGDRRGPCPGLVGH